MTPLPTPLEPAPASLGGDRPLFLKREDVHELGAFKWRGALPVLIAYRDAGADTGSMEWEYLLVNARRAG